MANNNNNRGFLLFTLLTVFPIISLPVIIKEVFRGKYYALHYFSFFLGLMSFLLAPTGDAYMYYREYESYKGLSFSEFLDTLNFDVIHETILYVLCRCNIYFGFFRFLITIVCYELLFEVFKIIIQKTNVEKDNIYNFKIFLLLFLAIGFATFLRGIRFNLAVSFYLYGFCVLYVNNKRVVGTLFLLLSALTHYCLIPIILPTIFFYFFNYRINRALTIIALLVLIVLSETLLSSILENIKVGVELQNSIQDYTTGYWASDVLQDRSLKYRIANTLGRLTLYPIVFIFFIKIKSYLKYGLFVFFLGLLILVSDMHTMYNRFSFLAIFIFLLPYLINIDKRIIKKEFALLLLCSTLSYISSIYSFKREISISKLENMLYMPLPGVLSTTYDKQWMDSRMYGNGDFDL